MTTTFKLADIADLVEREFSKITAEQLDKAAKEAVADCDGSAAQPNVSDTIAVVLTTYADHSCTAIMDFRGEDPQDPDIFVLEASSYISRRMWAEWGPTATDTIWFHLCAGDLKKGNDLRDTAGDLASAACMRLFTPIDKALAQFMDGKILVHGGRKFDLATGEMLDD